MLRSGLGTDFKAFPQILANMDGAQIPSFYHSRPNPLPHSADKLTTHFYSDHVCPVFNLLHQLCKIKIWVSHSFNEDFLPFFFCLIFFGFYYIYVHRVWNFLCSCTPSHLNAALKGKFQSKWENGRKIYNFFEWEKNSFFFFFFIVFKDKEIIFS